MDPTQLHTCFQASLQPDPNVRTNAELQLREAEKVPGFLGACLDIMLANEIDQAVKSAAAIYVKNKISRNWKPSESTSSSTVDHDEKPLIRERIIPAIISVSPHIKPQLIAALGAIISSDFPSEWPQLYDVALNLLNGSDLQAVSTGLLIMAEIAKIYRWVENKDRPVLDKLIIGAFPRIHSIGHSLLNETSNEAGEMLKFVLKIYKFAVYFDLPIPLQESQSLIDWGTLHLSVIQKEYPPDVLAIPESDRLTNPWSKCKKWAFFNLQRLFTKYAIPAKGSKNEYINFLKLFNHNFVPQILQVYFQQIDGWVNKKIWLSGPCIYHLLGFLEVCIKQKSTWLLLKPHINAVISAVVFPLLIPSEELLESFEDEPEEYVHRLFDVYEISNSPDMAAINFVYTLVSKRSKSTLQPLLQFINGILDSYNSNPSLQLAKQKEAVLRMMSNISHVLTGPKSPISNMIESFLTSYIFPDFQSQFGFLRARACEVSCRFVETDFKDINNLSIMLQGSLQSLDDKYLPVRLEAALALQPLIAREEINAGISTRVPEIMQKLIDLTNSIDMDALSGVMDEFVDTFAEQLSPFSVELGGRLTQQFIRIANELIEADKNVDELDDPDNAVVDKQMAALGILNNIVTLLLSLENSVEIVQQLEEILAPAISLVFENGLSIYFNEVGEIIENTTFALSRITPIMWKILEQIHFAYTEHEMELDDILPAFHNYLMYGREELKSLPQYVEVFTNVVTTTLSPEKDDQLSLMERAMACNLAQTVILSLGDTAGKHIPTFLGLVIYRFKNDSESALKNINYRTNLLDVIISSIYYNPTATLQVLTQESFVTEFFNFWFQSLPTLTRVYDLKLSALALLEILRLPDGQVLGSIDQIGKGLGQVLKLLPGAIKNLDEKKKKFESGLLDEDGELFTGRNNFDDDDDNEDEDDDVNDEEAREYMEFLTSESDKLNEKTFGYYDEEDEELDDDPLENTPIDEIKFFSVLKHTMLGLQQSDASKYQKLISGLDSETCNMIEQLMQLADSEETN